MMFRLMEYDLEQAYWNLRLARSAMLYPTVYRVLPQQSLDFAHDYAKIVLRALRTHNLDVSLAVSLANNFTQEVNNQLFTKKSAGLLGTGR